MNNWNDGSENYNLRYRIAELERQLAEAQQARDKLIARAMLIEGSLENERQARERAEKSRDYWDNKYHKLIEEKLEPLIGERDGLRTALNLNQQDWQRERDTLRELLREASALIRVAHHWDKLHEANSLCERITAALKE